MYLKDPKNNNPSVSLTLTMSTWIVALGFTVNAALNGNVDPLMNLFYATAALYFGRRVSSNKKPTSSNKDTASE